MEFLLNPPTLFDAEAILAMLFDGFVGRSDELSLSVPPEWNALIQWMMRSRFQCLRASYQYRVTYHVMWYGTVSV